MLTFSQILIESLIQAVASATNTQTSAVKCSVNYNITKSITLEANKTENNGENTSTKVTIEEIANGKFKITGAIQNAQRSLQLDRTIITNTASLSSILKQYLVMVRVVKRNQSILNKIRNYV